MTIEVLYELMKQGFEQVNTRLDRIDTRFDHIDVQLRDVETGVAEIKGRRLAFKEWVPIGFAVIAVIVSIIALVK